MFKIGTTKIFGPKLVKFSNGLFGVRRWFLIFWYMDLRTTGYWWGKGDHYFCHCQGTEAEAKSATRRALAPAISEIVIEFSP